MREEYLPFPRILSKIVDVANDKLARFQSEVQKDVLESSLEIMGFLSLDPSEGWKVDLESKRFVLVVEEEDDEAEEPEAEESD